MANTSLRRFDFARRVEYVDCKIGPASTDSPIIDLGGMKLVGLIFPVAFPGGSASLQILNVDDAGVATSISGFAGSAFSIPTATNLTVMMSEPSGGSTLDLSFLRRLIVRTNANDNFTMQLILVGP